MQVPCMAKEASDGGRDIAVKQEVTDLFVCLIVHSKATILLSALAFLITSMTVLRYIAILPLDLHAMFFSLCADLRSADDQALAQVCSALNEMCVHYTKYVRMFTLDVLTSLKEPTCVLL